MLRWLDDYVDVYLYIYYVEFHKFFFKWIILLAHLMLFGREFHRAALEVAISRLPFLTVVLRFGTSDMVDEERMALQECTIETSHIIMYVGACPCNTLNFNTRSFDIYSLLTASFSIGVMCWCRGVRLTVAYLGFHFGGGFKIFLEK